MNKIKKTNNHIRDFSKQVIKKSPNIPAQICISLFELGEITIDAFLSPRYSFTKPTRIFLGMDEYKTKTESKPKKESIRQAIKRLEKQGFIVKRDKIISLSKWGKIVLENVKIKKDILSKSWDQKYRLVIFDIPEKKRRLRRWLREELYLLNYIQLQKSVFISKYPLTPDIVEEIRRYEIDRYVNYLLVDRVFYDSKIKDLL